MISHLRASYVWRDVVMDDRVYPEPGAVTLGPRAGVTFVTPELGLPAGFSMIRPGARGYLLTLGPRMRGRMRLGGEEIEVADFMRRGGGGAEGSEGGFRATSIEPGDWGVVHLDGAGDHTLFFQFVPAEPPLPRSKFRDATLILPGLAFALLLHTALLAVIFHLAPDRSSAVFPGKRELVAGYLIQRPPPREPPAPEQAQAGEKEAESKTPPAATRGKEGKAGGEGERERARAPDPDQGEPDQPLPAAVQVGLLSTRSREAIRQARDRGGFDEKLGKALARMQGPSLDGSMAGSGAGRGTGFGPGEGTGTSTRGGDGTGGGGKKSFGDVQTSRPLDTGGTRAARGTPGGRGVKEVGVKVDTGDPGGDLGGLTAAEILKVVNSRRNGLRTCYERELQRSKDLGGKVVISWKINASGAVLDARVAKSSLGSGRVEDCLVRQVSSMRFPSPRNGAIAKVNFPFLFAPR